MGRRGRGWNPGLGLADCTQTPGHRCVTFPRPPQQRTTTGKLLPAETDSVPATQATGLKPTRVTLPPGAQGGAFLTSPSFWRLPQGFLGSGVSLQPSLCAHVPFCLCQISLPRGDLSRDLRPTWTIQDGLLTSRPFPSADLQRPAFPNKVIFMGSRDVTWQPSRVPIKRPAQGNALT